jgi:hypothetical protein
MLGPTRAVLAGAFLGILGGCGVTGIGASDRAHREESAVRTLVHGEDSFESIYGTLTERGYQCADQRPLEGGELSYAASTWI